MSTHRESPEQTTPAVNAEGRMPWGTAACALGIICAGSGVFLIDLTFEFVGILLGAAGYALGARRLGVATIVLSTVLLLVFLAISQGMVPGMDPLDPIAM